MIYKEAKGRWVFECAPCNERVEAFDQFRAIEYGQYHERTLEHAKTKVFEAAQAVVDAVNEMIRPVIQYLEPIMEPPANKPHDPTLLSDRRKWGGR